MTTHAITNQAAELDLLMLQNTYGNQGVRLLSKTEEALSNLAGRELLTEWHVYKLSNGGCFVAPVNKKPTASMRLMLADQSALNLSYSAAGLAVTLLILRHLLTTERRTSSPLYAQQEFLTEYIAQHPEKEAILCITPL